MLSTFSTDSVRTANLDVRAREVNGPAEADAGDLKLLLIRLLKSKQSSLKINGEVISRDRARLLLQELVPAHIRIADTCRLPVSITAAAPHVSFDHWSEHFCNRVAKHFGLGRVIAKNYRDQDDLHLPVSVGRHLHVNRPTESEGPSCPEYETERARGVFRDYVNALRIASGAEDFPIALLLEFHSHRSSPALEIAARGVDRTLAGRLEKAYAPLAAARLCPLLIEPLHKLRLTAKAAKRHGSMAQEVARTALHIEIPLSTRRNDAARRQMGDALIVLTEVLLEHARRADS